MGGGAVKAEVEPIAFRNPAIRNKMVACQSTIFRIIVTGALRELLQAWQRAKAANIKMPSTRYADYASPMPTRPVLMDGCSLPRERS